MSRYLIGQAGIVKNIVESAVAFTQVGFDVLLDPTGTTNVGDVYDPKDVQINNADQVAFTVLLRHENLIRELIRALRATSTAANTAATNAGLPTTANSADVTVAQFRVAVKSLLS